MSEAIRKEQVSKGSFPFVKKRKVYILVVISIDITWLNQF